MALRPVLMVAMPCAEVVEVDGALDVFYAANLVLEREGAADVGYDVAVLAGSTSATFPTSTKRPKSPTAVTISAQLADVVKSTTLSGDTLSMNESCRSRGAQAWSC
jgi:hypothetical protein